MTGEWLRKPKKPISVVFIHGILSSAESCWRNENGTYWPTLLEQQDGLQEIGIYSFTYQTDFFSGDYRLSDVVDALKEKLDLDGLLKKGWLIFVCHSMGGIVARKFIVERAAYLIGREINFGLFLLASPSLGSRYADWLSPLAQFFGHKQAEALRFADNNPWLSDLDKEFLNLKEGGKLNIVGKELVEDKFIVLKKLWRTKVVPEISGAKYFGEHFKVPGSDHFSISKPADANTDQHRLLCKFVSDFVPSAIQSTSNFAPPSPPENQPRPRQAQSEFEKQVKREIGELLGRAKLRLLREALLRIAEDRQSGNARGIDPENLLIPAGVAFDVKSSIDALHKAAENCLESLISPDSSNLKKIKDGAKDVLGWLVLLAVSETWVREWENRTQSNKRSEPMSGQRVANAENLKRDIDRLQSQCELLNDKLKRLNKQRIRETRAEEKFRLEPLIKETQTELDQIDEQLKDLRDRLEKADEDTRQNKSQSDDQNRRAEVFDHLLSATHIEIPVGTEASTEVVIARLRSHRARLELDRDDFRVLGTTQVAVDRHLERGMAQSDRLIEIKKEIWKRVLKREVPMPFGQNQKEELKYTLEIRHERGESYYITIAADQGDVITGNVSLLKQLRHDLPYLGVFAIGAEIGDQVLVIPEPHLVVLVREFLLMLRKYQ